MLPERKHARLKNYDYSQNGCYFVTVCVQGRRPLLGKVVEIAGVGRGALTPPNSATAVVVLSDEGKTVEKYVKNISAVYQGVELSAWVIMPDHLHFLVTFDRPENGGGVRAPRPTLHTMVRSLKTMVTRDLGCGIWQASYHEHVVRTEDDFRDVCEYISGNPARWLEKQKQRRKCYV